MEATLRLNTGSDSRRLPNAVLGIMILVIAEIMFFAALMSAHTIARSSAMGGLWPPPGQPRLPVERTAINTGVLLLSGVLLWLGNRYMSTSPNVGRGSTGLAIA